MNPGVARVAPARVEPSGPSELLVASLLQAPTTNEDVSEAKARLLARDSNRSGVSKADRLNAPACSRQSDKLRLGGRSASRADARLKLREARLLGRQEGAVERRQLLPGARIVQRVLHEIEQVRLFCGAERQRDDGRIHRNVAHFWVVDEPAGIV